MPLFGPPLNAQIGGNTAGATALVSSGTLTLAGGNNITLSQAGNAITIAGGAAGGGGTFSGGISTDGNTAGTTGFASASLQLVGGNNVTLSQSTSANAAYTLTIVGQTVPPIGTAVKVVSTVGSTGTITRFAPEDHQHQGVNSVGISNIGNTSGTSGAGPGRLVLAGGSHITLSQNTDATGSTVTISAQVPRQLSFWQNVPAGTAVAVSGTSNGSLWVQPVAYSGQAFPGDMTISTMNLHFSGSGTANASTAAYTFSVSVGLYTQTGMTLSLLNSVSTALTGVATSNQSTAYHGQRWLSLHSSQWSSQPVMEGGRNDYYLAFWCRSSGEAKALSWVGYAPVGAGVASGSLGVSATTGQVYWGYVGFAGASTASTSGAMPAAIQYTELQRTAGLAVFNPHMMFDNLGHS